MLKADPVFIVEDARSGSTFLTNLLNQHPDIGLAPETSCVINLMNMFWNKPIASLGDLDKALDLVYREEEFADLGLVREELQLEAVQNLPISFAELARTILRLYCQSQFPGSGVWGVKKGRYIFDSLQLVEFFPSAKFINIIRDGRAVFSSKKKVISLQTGQPFETCPIAAAKRWVRAVQSFDRLKRKYPENCISISYEALVLNTEEVLSSIFRFLEVDLNPSSIPDVSGSTGNAWVPNRYDLIHPNVGKPPQPSRVNAWKEELTAEEIKAFESVAGQELRNRGYELLYGHILIPLMINYRISQVVSKVSKAFAK